MGAVKLLAFGRAGWQAGGRCWQTVQAAAATPRSAIWRQRLYWVLDVDIRRYFDTIAHSHLRAFLDQRVTDGVIRWTIDKWLKAGVIEDGLLQHTTAGSPQGVLSDFAPSGRRSAILPLRSGVRLSILLRYNGTGGNKIAVMP